MEPGWNLSISGKQSHLPGPSLPLEFSGMHTHTQIQWGIIMAHILCPESKLPVLGLLQKCFMSWSHQTWVVLDSTRSLTEM